MYRGINFDLSYKLMEKIEGTSTSQKNVFNVTPSLTSLLRLFMF